MSGLTHWWTVIIDSESGCGIEQVARKARLTPPFGVKSPESGVLSPAV